MTGTRHTGFPQGDDSGVEIHVVDAETGAETNPETLESADAERLQREAKRAYQQAGGVTGGLPEGAYGTVPGGPQVAGGAQATAGPQGQPGTQGAAGTQGHPGSAQPGHPAQPGHLGHPGHLAQPGHPAQPGHLGHPGSDFAGPANAGPANVGPANVGPANAGPANAGHLQAPAQAGIHPQPGHPGNFPQGSLPAGTAEELFKRLVEMEAERDELVDSLRRVQAEFENYRKRIMKQESEVLERAGQSIVEKLLPVLDTLELALKHGDGSDPSLEPLRMVAASMSDALAKEGLERIDPFGAEFDPSVHDAVAHEPGPDGPSGKQVQTVSEVMRAGYRWKGRVVRPAMVKVRG